MLFTFLFFPLLFTACPNIELTGIDNELARQGLGGFALQLAETTGRTVLPNSPVLPDFEVFELIFTATVGGDDRTVLFDNTGAILPTVILVAGTYNITVNAYLDGNATNITPTNLAARGILNGAVINPGTTLAQDINLRALLNEGQGTFAWSVNITADNVTTARMSIVSLTGGPAIPDETLNNSGPTSGPTNLEAGIYNVTFRLTRTTTVSGESVIHETVWYEMLYVYSSLTSTMSPLTFDNDSFHRTNYVVTFIFNDGPHIFTNPPIGTGYRSVLHAGVIGTTTGPGLGSDPLDALASPGYRFDGWYTTSGFTAGTEWNLATGAILRDMTLYARWTPNQITITLIDVDNIPAVLGITFAPNVTPIITLSRSGAGGNPAQQTITLGGTFSATTDTLSWVIQGKGIHAPGGSNPQNVTGTTSPITLDATNPVYNSLGNHTVQLNITRTVGADAIQYRTSFWFRIVE